jgi:asparaginyl-tRNA synthetase
MKIKSIYNDSEKYVDKEVRVEGWVRTVRSSKNFGFIELNDGTFFRHLQIVFDENLDNFESLTKLPIGSALSVEGVLIKSPAKGQIFELQAKIIRLEAASSQDYPLQKKRHSFEFLRTIAHLRPRSNTFNAVFRVRSVMSFLIHRFFWEKGFVYIHTPIITTSDCEGAGEMFTVTSLNLEKIKASEERLPDPSRDFFGKKAGLTVSGQLNAEAMAMAFKNVYTFGPTFRAENSNTARHAAEFWMVEPEMAFAELADDMFLAEEMIKYIINNLRKECPEEMEFFNQFIDKELEGRLDNVANSSFERISYAEAIKILEKSEKKFEYPVNWGADLQSEHERYITEEVFKKPVFVTDYPEKIKAFYMRLNDDGQTVAAMDLLVPGIGEIVGGSQREERMEILERRMTEAGLDPKDYWWYLDLRKYGGVKHAGFGLGFERAIMYMTGISNIRDVIAFPRVPKNADF